MLGRARPAACDASLAATALLSGALVGVSEGETVAPDDEADRAAATACTAPQSLTALLLASPALLALAHSPPAAAPLTGRAPTRPPRPRPPPTSSSHRSTRAPRPLHPVQPRKHPHQDRQALPPATRTTRNHGLPQKGPPQGASSPTSPSSRPSWPPTLHSSTDSRGPSCPSRPVRRLSSLATAASARRASCSSSSRGGSAASTRPRSVCPSSPALLQDVPDDSLCARRCRLLDQGGHGRRPARHPAGESSLPRSLSTSFPCMPPGSPGPVADLLFLSISALFRTPHAPLHPRPPSPFPLPPPARRHLASHTHSCGTRPARNASSRSASPSTAAPTAASSCSTSTRARASRRSTAGGTSSSSRCVRRCSPSRRLGDSPRQRCGRRA